MNYIEQLISHSSKNRSIVCMGLDPVLDDIPLKGTISERIFVFYENLLNTMQRKNVFPACVKPNYAFYAQYGFEGLHALADLIALYRRNGLPVILDYKRGDIGKTALAYAREAFDFFSADAVTLSPFLGYDSIKPYMDHYPDKGYYVLNKTSNPSSTDMQDVCVEGEPYYSVISRRIVSWHSTGIGAVVGATFPMQLKTISNIFIASGKDIPLLIPGIGTQGGDLSFVISVLKHYKDVRIHRINSSSEINYAYKKYPQMDVAEASVHVLNRLNEEIDSLLDHKLN